MVDTVHLTDLVKKTGLGERMQYNMEDSSVVTNPSGSKRDGNNSHLFEAREGEHALKMFYPQQLHGGNRNGDDSAHHEYLIGPLMGFCLCDDGIHAEDSQEPNT